MWPFDDEDENSPAAGSDLGAVTEPWRQPAAPMAPSPAAPSVSPEQSKLVRDYLEAKRKGDRGVAAARSRGDTQNALAMALEGVGQIATAGSAARGGPSVKAGQISDRIGQAAEQRVADARSSRKDSMDAVLAQDDMQQREKERERKGVLQGREDEQYARQQRDLKDMDDPESETSRQYQSLAARLTGKQPEAYAGRSASQLKSLTPVYEKIYGVEQQTKDRAAAASDRAAARADAKADRDLRRDELRKNKVDDLVDKDSQALVGQLKGTSRDSIGQAKGKIAAAERVDELLAHYKDEDKVPPEIMHELAISMATMLAPGVPAESTIQGLKPHTIEGKLAEMLSYATGTPTGAGQGDYVKLYRDVVRREHRVANDQYKREVSRLLPGFKRLKTNSPDTYAQILANSGLSEGDFDDSGVYRPAKEDPHAPAAAPRANTLSLGGVENTAQAEESPAQLQQRMIDKAAGRLPGGASSAHPQDNAALEWARANPNDPRAKAILEANGVN